MLTHSTLGNCSVEWLRCMNLTLVEWWQSQSHLLNTSVFQMHKTPTGIPPALSGILRLIKQYAVICVHTDSHRFQSEDMAVLTCSTGSSLLWWHHSSVRDSSMTGNDLTQQIFCVFHSIHTSWSLRCSWTLHLWDTYFMGKAALDSPISGFPYICN